MGLAVILKQVDNFSRQGLCNPFTHPSSCPLLALTLVPSYPDVEPDTAPLNSTSPPAIASPNVMTTANTEVMITIQYNGSMPEYWTNNDTRATVILQDHGEHIDFWHSQSAKVGIKTEQWAPTPAPESFPSEDCATLSCRVWHILEQRGERLCNIVLSLFSLWSMLGAWWIRLSNKGWIPRSRAQRRRAMISQEERRLHQDAFTDQLSQRWISLIERATGSAEQRRSLEIQRKWLARWRIIVQQRRLLTVSAYAVEQSSNAREADRINSSNAALAERNDALERERRDMEATHDKVVAKCKRLESEIEAPEKEKEAVKGRLDGALQKLQEIRSAKESGDQAYEDRVSAAERDMRKFQRQAAAAEATVSLFQDTIREEGGKVTRLEDASKEQVRKAQRAEAAKNAAEEANSRLQREREQLQAELKREQDQAKVQAKQAGEARKGFTDKDKLIKDLQAQLARQTESFDGQAKDLQVAKASLAMRTDDLVRARKTATAAQAILDERAAELERATEDQAKLGQQAADLELAKSTTGAEDKAVHQATSNSLTEHATTSASGQREQASGRSNRRAREETLAAARPEIVVNVPADNRPTRRTPRWLRAIGTRPPFAVRGAQTRAPLQEGPARPRVALPRARAYTRMALGGVQTALPMQEAPAAPMLSSLAQDDAGMAEPPTTRRKRGRRGRRHPRRKALPKARVHAGEEAAEDGWMDTDEESDEGDRS